MANISLCFGSNKYVKPVILTCGSVSASHDTSSGSTSNFYSMLSLSSKKAGTEEIKRAYRILALKYHPDVCKDKDTTNMFILLQKAYKTLLDPVSRQEYDCALGCCEPGHICVGCTISNHDVRDGRRWEDQIIELKKRSCERIENKDGSWGNRVRYVNRQNNEC